jgi:hypothetical protein
MVVRKVSEKQVNACKIFLISIVSKLIKISMKLNFKCRTFIMKRSQVESVRLKIKATENKSK